MINPKRLYQSFIYAWRGLAKTWREEQNLRIQTAVGLIVLLFAWCSSISRLEWIILILIINLVILMELANSAVERVTDVLKPRINGYVKEIKDIMAAAVLVASLAAAIVGIIIFWPQLYKLFGQ